jgi:protein O-mannosyl-transferase
VRSFTRLFAPWTQPALLGLLCVATFSAGLTGGFVLDDNLAILHHPVVDGAAPLVEAFRRNFWGDPLGTDPPSFRPLTTLSFALDHRLFGESALAFHVTSLLWYIGMVLAGWSLGRRCLGPWAAFLAMAFFAVMPVHVENVSSLVGRADTMGVLLSLLALLVLSPTLVEDKATTLWRLLLAALFFVAAMLCKESMAVLPVIVALFVAYRRRSDIPLSPIRAHVPSLVMFAVLGAYVVFRIRVEPATFSYVAPDDVLVGAHVWQKAGYGLELLARYMGLVVAPTDLCTGRKFAEVFRPAHVSWAMVAGAGLLGLAAFVSWRTHRKGAFPFVPAAFVAWLLVTGLIVAIPESMADRFLLLPSLFLCFSVGPALLSLWRKGRVRPALLLAALGLQVLLSNIQARTWHDEGALLAHAVRACPDSLHNHFRYAEYLSERGETAEAVWHYALATKGRNAFPHAWSHPAKKEERSVPIDQRLREMHRLLQVHIDESVWRSRFVKYLRSLGRWREARLVAQPPPGD